MVGFKLHLVNQQIGAGAGDEDTTTENYFLRNRSRFEIKLNINGVSIADGMAKLGI